MFHLTELELSRVYCVTFCLFVTIRCVLLHLLEEDLDPPNLLFSPGFLVASDVSIYAHTLPHTFTHRFILSLSHTCTEALCTHTQHARIARVDFLHTDTHGLLRHTHRLTLASSILSPSFPKKKRFSFVGSFSAHPRISCNLSLFYGFLIA